MDVTIILSWPPAALLPNAKRRSHWAKAIVPTKVYRSECYWLTKAAMGRRSFLWQPSVRIAFSPPDARRRDDDGMIGAFKAGRDGICSALGIDDYRLMPSYTFLQPHRPLGRITVTLSAPMIGAST